MEENIKVLALDFGASSGRAIVGSFDGEKITLQEIHRFANEPVNLLGTMYWDVLRLFHDIKTGLIKSKKIGNIKSIGIGFPELKAHGRFIRPYSTFDSFGLRRQQVPCGVACGDSFVSGTDADYILGEAGNLIQVGFQKRSAAVRTVIVPEAEVDGEGFLEK